MAEQREKQQNKENPKIIAEIEATELLIKEKKELIKEKEELIKKKEELEIELIEKELIKKYENVDPPCGIFFDFGHYKDNLSNSSKSKVPKPVIEKEEKFDVASLVRLYFIENYGGGGSGSDTKDNCIDFVEFDRNTGQGIFVFFYSVVCAWIVLWINYFILVLFICLFVYLLFVLK